MRLEVPLRVVIDATELPEEEARAAAEDWAREAFRRWAGRDWRGRQRYGVRHIELVVDAPRWAR